MHVLGIKCICDVERVNPRRSECVCVYELSADMGHPAEPSADVGHPAMPNGRVRIPARHSPDELETPAR